jgi:hypothetical protein
MLARWKCDKNVGTGRGRDVDIQTAIFSGSTVIVAGRFR